MYKFYIFIFNMLYHEKFNNWEKIIQCYIDEYELGNINFKISLNKNRKYNNLIIGGYFISHTPYDSVMCLEIFYKNKKQLRCFTKPEDIKTKLNITLETTNVIFHEFSHYRQHIGNQEHDFKYDNYFENTHEIDAFSRDIYIELLLYGSSKRLDEYKKMYYNGEICKKSYNRLLKKVYKNIMREENEYVSS